MAGAKVKNKVGRPTKYKPEYCDQIIDFFNQPPTYEEIVDVTTGNGSKYKKKIIHPTQPKFLIDFAHEIGVSYCTITRWEKDYEDFCNAYKEAKKLQERLFVTNGTLGLFNASVTIFTLKNIAGWRDEQHIKQEGEVKHTHTVIKQDLEERLLQLTNSNRISEN